MSLGEMQNFFDQSQDVIAIVDRSYHYVLVNLEYCRYWNMRREDIVGSHVIDIVGKEAFDEAIHAYIEQCLNGDHVRYEKWLDFPGMGRRIVDVKYAPYHNDAGEIVGIFLTSRDITELKGLEAQIGKERDRFEDIVNSLAVGLLLCDSDLSIIWHNRRLQELFPDVELHGRKCYEALDMEDRQCVDCPARQTLLTGGDYSVEHYHLSSGRWYALTTVLTHDADTGDDMVLGHLLDITDQKIAQATIQASEKRFRNLFEDVNMIAVQGYDRERRVVYWNPASEQLYGFSREEARGQLLENLIIPEQMRDAVIAGHAEWVNGGSAIPAGELELVHKDGSRVSVYSSHIMQETSLGENIMYCLDVDLSEIKRIHNQLVLAKEEAEAANHAKSEFLTNMSHEIRTPLNGIQGMLSLLLGMKLEEDQEEYVRAGLEASMRLNRLLSDILDLSRLDAGMIAVEKRPFDLRDQVQQVRELFSLSFDTESVSLHCHAAENVPQFVVGDAARLQQILINLVGNALKYTDEGEVRLDVSLLPPIRSDQHRVYIVVSDTGLGIDKSSLESLFAPFVQESKGFSRQYQGAGLGLSICKRLVDLMGGNMSVDSEPGKGSSFHLALPFGKYVAASAGAAFFEFEEEGTAIGLNVLLAEDDHVNSMVGKRLLQKAGCSVSVVSNGLKAVEMLRKQDFDAVFMDVQMPGMDGLDATKGIRRGMAGASRCDIPIFALTAFTMAGDRERFIDAGMDDYIPKPVEMSDLLRLLRHAARKKYGDGVADTPAQV